MILGVSFFSIWLSQDIPSILNGTIPSNVTEAGLLSNPIHVLDMGLYLPAMIVVGLSLIRNKSLGYVFSLPLIVFSLLTLLGIP